MKTSRREVGNSPFRRSRAAERVAAAKQMITKRKREIREIEKALRAAETTPKMAKNLRLRLRSSENNLAAWEGYLTEAYREPRAVITPKGA